MIAYTWRGREQKGENKSYNFPIWEKYLNISNTHVGTAQLGLHSWPRTVSSRLLPTKAARRHWQPRCLTSPMETNGGRSGKHAKHSASRIINAQKSKIMRASSLWKHLTVPGRFVWSFVFSFKTRAKQFASSAAKEVHAFKRRKQGGQKGQEIWDSKHVSETFRKLNSFGKIEQMEVWTSQCLWCYNWTPFSWPAGPQLRSSAPRFTAPGLSVWMFPSPTQNHFLSKAPGVLVAMGGCGPSLYTAGDILHAAVFHCQIMVFVMDASQSQQSHAIQIVLPAEAVQLFGSLRHSGPQNHKIDTLVYLSLSLSIAVVDANSSKNGQKW